MKVTFLGTGTSHGIPVIACDCECCNSSNLKNHRYRTSIFVESSDKKYVLVDTSPEFRLQAIKYKIRKPNCDIYRQPIKAIVSSTFQGEDNNEF